MAKTPILTKDRLVQYDENIKDYIDTGLENKVSKTDIVNNLVSTDVDAPLSAMQGKILKDTIDRLEVPGAVLYRGTIGTDGDITELPSTYKRGDMYRVITEGTYSEQKCEVGDFLFCTRDNILTVATLPNYDKNSRPYYIIYQVYNPQTNENGNIYFAAMEYSSFGSAILNRVYYDIKDGAKKLYFSDPPFYVLRFTTNNNGVTWSDKLEDSNYGAPYSSIFTDTETSAIKILNSNIEIYNNENAIIYPPNPWGLSGYATDWAVIQGNLEDTIGEGAIYIDPDETSSEIENIDSVTSAKYVSYSNADSGLEATNVQDAIDETSSMAKAISKGKDISEKDLFYDLGAENESFIGYGTNMTDIPENESTSEFVIQQTCTDDKIIQFASAINSDNHLYYRAFYKPEEFSFPKQWRNLGIGEELRYCFTKYDSTEAGTIFGTPGCGVGLYFFTIIESISSTDRSNPTFGSIYIDTENQSWVSFQKGSDSVITDIKYYDNYNDLAYGQIIITLSANRYVSVFTLKLDGCCKESQLNKLS